MPRPSVTGRWAGSPRSVRARVTAGSVVVLGVVLTAAITLTSLLARDTVERDINQQAADAALQVAETIATRHPGHPMPPRNDVTRIQVVEESGTVVAASAALEGSAPVTDARPATGDLQVRTMECEDDAFAWDCLSIAGLEVTDSVYGDVMVYAAVPRPPFLSGHVLEIALVSLGLLVLTLAGGGVWWAVGRTLRPVEEIRAELRRITAADLSRRVPVPGTGDEIADLAGTANETLERLEAAAQQQRRFVSDASHELRTPLTGLQAQAELALEEPDEEHLRKALHGVLRETRRLQRLSDDLLQLARLEAATPAAREPVDLGELVAEEVARPRNGPEVSTDTAPGVVVDANRVQLARVLTNLLANAARHAEGRTLVDVTSENRQAVLRLHDDGSGVPAGERERIFERFTRLDESRRRDHGGTGLGLPIAREIAQAHGGSLTVDQSTELGGAVFVLRLPLREADGRRVPPAAHPGRASGTQPNQPGFTNPAS